MTTTTTENKEVCSITIAFPVESDEATMEVRNKVKEALKDYPDARIDFRIMNMGNKRV